MGLYNVSRNIEASLIQEIETKLATAWSDVRTTKSFSQSYDLDLPVVCVNVGNTSFEWAEIGDNAIVRNPQVFIHIFASSDGQKLDLTDFLVKELKNGIPYYKYTVTNGVVSAKVLDGKIRVLSIDSTPINLDDEKNNLDTHDRFRILITLSILNYLPYFVILASLLLFLLRYNSNNNICFP